MEKSPDAFRTISEVADDLDIPQHVLRFWETRFTQIKPMKRSGGRRYYRPDDVDLLRGIRRLLYGEGYTIRGVQRILKENGIKAVQRVADGMSGASFGAIEDEISRTLAEDDDDAATPRPDINADEDDEDGDAPLIPAPMRGVAASADDAQDEVDETDDETDDESGPIAGIAGQMRSFETTTRLESLLADLLECRDLLNAAMHEPDGASEAWHDTWSSPG